MAEAIEELETNIARERKILEEILALNKQLKQATTAQEKSFFEKAITSLLAQLKILNNSIPFILSRVAVKELRELPALPAPAPTAGAVTAGAGAGAAGAGAEARTTKIATKDGFLTIQKEERARFLQELRISEEMLKKLKKKKKIVKEEEEKGIFAKPNKFVVIASKLFSRKAIDICERGGYRQLAISLKKANMPYLPSTYLSIIWFSTLLAFIFGLIISSLTSFFHIGMVVGKLFPVFTPLGMTGLASRFAKNFALSLFLPILTFIFVYSWPATQAASIKGKIDNELPFAIIHMSAVAGSGIEPSKVLQIIATSKEYPVVSGEMRKVINQINIYGLDLVSALRSVAKVTSSEKLSGLLNGIATNIVGGGGLKEYLEKKAADMLLDYKLARKKYATIAETSMDMYIGILITAPLIFMVLLILMGTMGLTIGGFTFQTLSFLIVAIIVVLNIFFLIFLQIRTPKG